MINRAPGGHSRFWTSTALSWLWFWICSKLQSAAIAGFLASLDTFLGVTAVFPRPPFPEVSEANTLSSVPRAADHCSHDSYSGLLSACFGSQDFNQPAASDQDAETIHYASLTHLNHSGTKDPIDSDSHMADRLLSVEYASITRQRPQLSMSPVLDGEPRN